MAIAMLRRQRWTCSPLPLSRRTRPLPRDGSSRPHAYLMVGCGLTGRPPGTVAHGQPHRQPHWHERAVAERAVRGGVLPRPSSSWGTNRHTIPFARAALWAAPRFLVIAGLRHGIAAWYIAAWYIAVSLFAVCRSCSYASKNRLALSMQHGPTALRGSWRRALVGAAVKAPNPDV